MTVMDTPAEQPAGRNARAAILEAGRAEAAKGGDISIKAVASRAGVTRQAVYYHFGGARGLRAALAAEGFAQPGHDEPTRERLVDAAIAVLSKPGGGLASIEALAAEAGMTKGAFYHHFVDRRELLRAVAARVSPVDAILATLAETADAPLREGLVALAKTYYREMGARVGLIRSLAANASRDPELGATVMGEVIGRAAPVAFQWFERRIERGELRAIDGSFVMQALFGPLFLVVVLGEDTITQMSVLGIQPAVYNIEAYVDFLVEGIAARRGEEQDFQDTRSIQLQEVE